MSVPVDCKSGTHPPPPPFMSSNEVLSEDTVKYIHDKHVTQLMEYLLRSIITEKPENPLKHLHAITGKPLPPQLVIAGPPASGKGTQAVHICDFYKEKNGQAPVHVSTGDLLREEVRKGTHLGTIAKDYMNKGDLVPDSLIIGIVRNRLCEEDAVLHGWLLDGFPRSRAQAEALDAAGFSPRLVVALETPEDILIERVEGRRIDPETGMSYHLKYNPPPADDLEVMARLQHRDDDTREILLPRLERFHEMLKGLVSFYAPVMVHIDANRPPERIAQDITDYLSHHDAL